MAAPNEVELRVPSVGESVTEVQVGGWLVAAGAAVARDQVVVVLETDKATVEVPAPVAGAVVRIAAPAGAKVKVGELLGVLAAGAAGTPAAAPSAPASSRPQSAPPAPVAASPPAAPVAAVPAAAPSAPSAPPRVMPAAARALHDAGLKASDVAASGPGGRLLKEDVERAVTTTRAAPPAPPAPPAPVVAAPVKSASSPAGERAIEIVPMSPLRKTVARRLVQAQQVAALLTTFNEIDMGAVVELRKTHGEAFQQKHGVKLGFMSFFVKAVVDALATVPALNAQVRSTGPDDPGSEILYHHYCDIGVAVGGGKGLVVPVLRDAERLSFAEIERAIADFARRAQESKLGLDELAGGTFTISNGGVYGSLLSTPIVNPPQSGVLGLHAIQERPVARDGQVVIRPMMYVALTYDHRLVDGREAVTFLRRVKECVEAPARIALEA